jgi:hypothetical protein
MKSAIDEDVRLFPCSMRMGKSVEMIFSDTHMKIEGSALNQYLRVLIHPEIVTSASILIDSLSAVLGEPGDDQPFVANNEKVNTNLYLYSVSTRRALPFYCRGFLNRVN